MASETGATPDQIERAAEHWAVSASVDWSRAPLETRAYWCASMDRLASHLVRPHERINPIDDLIALCEAADQHLAYLRNGGETTADQADALSATVDRVRAVIGGTE